MIRKPERAGLVVTVLIALVMILVNFGEVAVAPNQYMLSDNEDGIKNYYTPLYFVHHDRGSRFDGMLHPYGDHVVFSDNQPAVSWLLNAIDSYLLPVAPFTIGILNFLMLISQLLACVMIFKILRHYKVMVPLAVIASVFIGLMSPQFERMLGHFALSYSFFIPLIWYWLIAYYAQRKWKYLIAVALATLVFSFIHVYYLPMALIFAVLFLFITSIMDKMPWKKALAGLGIVMAPAMLVAGYMALVDNITDRPGHPAGLMEFRSGFTSIFLPNEGPFHEFLSASTGLENMSWEGFAYVGLVVTLVVVAVLFLAVLNYLLGNRIFDVTLPQSLWIALVAAVVILLYAMALPFRAGTEEMWDYLGTIKQFRSIGRFAWVFYYVIAVSVVFYINRTLAYLKRERRYATLVVMCLSGGFVWGVETIDYVARIGDRVPPREFAEPFVMAQKDNNTEWRKLKIDADDYQCILGFPFFLKGTERFYIPAHNNSLIRHMEVSLLTGLPMVNSVLARTSRSQGYRVAQITNQRWLPRGVVKDFTPDKPLLLVVAGEHLRENEAELLQRAAYLGTYQQSRLYELPLHALERERPGCDTMEDNRDEAFYENVQTLQRSDAGSFEDTAWHIYLKVDSVPLERGAHEFSIWADLRKVKDFWPILAGHVFDENGNEVYKTLAPVREVQNLYNDWVRIGLDFPLQNNAGRHYTIEIRTNCTEGELKSGLLREKNNNIIIKTDPAECSMNNFPVPDSGPDP